MLRKEKNVLVRGADLWPFSILLWPQPSFPQSLSAELSSCLRRQMSRRDSATADDEWAAKSALTKPPRSNRDDKS